jgi:hypothetical protein
MPKGQSERIDNTMIKSKNRQEKIKTMMGVIAGAPER